MNQFQNIRKELKQLPQWVCHRNKIPFNPLTREMAKAGQPNTWTSFDDAVKAFNKGNYDGIGFLFNNNGIVGIDLDKVIDETGALSAEATEIVALMDSYTEFSPSASVYIYALRLIFHQTAGKRVLLKCIKPKGILL